MTAFRKLDIKGEYFGKTFIGYFIGMYLKDKIGMHRYVMYTSVIIGVVVSIINTVLIIKMMLRISKERSGKGI